MNNWEIIKIAQVDALDRESGYSAANIIFALLDGIVTREEAEEALCGLVEDPVALLEEVVGETTTIL